MTSASVAMGEAVASLEKLKTSEALPAEMEALNHLLKAQADVKERQVTRQQAGSGGGANRAAQDMSSLFDRELQRQQQTNYETPTTTERRGDDASTLDKIKELARRQDELNARQQALARAGVSAEETRRELERLTREQSELRQRAEELAREMSRQDGSGQPDQQSRSQAQQGQQSGQQAGQRSSGQQSQGQQGQGQQSQGNSPGRSGGQGNSQQGQQAAQLRAASEEMRNAASGLQRQNAGEAAARGARALARLRDLERSLERGAPDERRRALGDLQMEARQLSDAERQIGRELEGGRGDADAGRRLAGEQQRLADRVRRLEEGLERQAGATGTGRPRATSRDAVSPAERGDAGAERAAAEAARDMERQRLADRMEQSASALRAGAPANGSAASRADRDEIARALDRVAERLASATADGDDGSRRLTDQLTRAQELRERIETLTRDMQRLDREATGGSGAPAATAEFAELRQEYTRQLEQTRELLEQLQREDPRVGQSGPGFTFEGQGMVLSAPGTEAFKQDFSRWAELARQATQALDRASSSLSMAIVARQSRDRLASGVDDSAPSSYKQQVDSYFKALATGR
jgi:archaellum component FlaC